MHRLVQLYGKETRLVAGLMSGTSLDGVDVVLARLSGSGRALESEVLTFTHVSYPEALRVLLLENSIPETSSVRELSQLNVRLAHLYAAAVCEAVEAADLMLADLDLVGSHGQTVHHVPDPAACAGQQIASTLQIGDPSTLATLLGTTVVGDFRPADMALGGQGAPLVPYFDYVYFSNEKETRGLLNLGGIANLTMLPAGASTDHVLAFDTGPANMVIDQLADRLFGQPYDAGGRLAAEGTPDKALLATLLEEDYFVQQPPKSTGRERFGTGYVDRLVNEGGRRGLSRYDLLASSTALTAYSIYQAYARFLREEQPIDVLIAAGGGTRNDHLMHTLAEVFAPIPVRTAAHYGLDPDAKEALCFAILAHETLNGVPTNLPSVTGASRPTFLGKLCVPG